MSVQTGGHFCVLNLTEAHRSFFLFVLSFSVLSSLLCSLNWSAPKKKDSAEGGGRRKVTLSSDQKRGRRKKDDEVEGDATANEIH